jgi:hypothetical protein
MLKLQRSMKGEEQRRKKNLPKLVRQRWNSGERVDGDPISPSNVRERSRTSGVEGKEVERR